MTLFSKKGPETLRSVLKEWSRSGVSGRRTRVPGGRRYEVSESLAEPGGSGPRHEHK